MKLRHIWFKPHHLTLIAWLSKLSMDIGHPYMQEDEATVWVLRAYIKQNN